MTKMVQEERLPILGGKAARSPSGTDFSRDCRQVVRAVPQDGSGSRTPSTSDEEQKVALDKGDGQEGPQPFKFSQLQSSKKCTLVLLGLATVAACACFSLLAPFFPAEAGAKGMSESVIGLVFSCYELTVFLTSPLYGNYMTDLGPRFVFIAGQFMAGGCSILFGTLNMVPAGATFTVLAFVLRIMMALGGSAFLTASFTIVANEFPDHLSYVFAALEVFTGIGYTIGPLIAGLLYDLGGFGLPFYTLGTFLLVWTLITYFFLPLQNDNCQQQKRQRSVLSLLSSPLIMVCCITCVMGTYNFGFLDASLSIHMEKFHVSAAVTGLCFMIVAATYSVCSPLHAWLADKKNLQYTLLPIGCMINLVSLMLIGPSPLLPFLKVHLWLVIVSLLLMGVGTGAVIIPVVKNLYIGARRLGFQEGLELDGLVSGLLTSSLHFGTFLGPTIGSSVMEATSYEWSATLNAGLSLFSFLLLMVYKLVERTCLRYDDKITRDSTNSSQVVLFSKEAPLPEESPVPLPVDGDVREENF